MKQGDFIARYQTEWDAFGYWLRNHAKKQPKREPEPLEPMFGIREFPHRYRRLCQQYALARVRGYSPSLVNQLQLLVQSGHQFMYRPRRFHWTVVVRFFAAEFPRLVREQFRYVGASALLLFVPLALTAALAYSQPTLIHSVYNPKQVSSYEHMYGSAGRSDRLARDGQSDLHMFGFYIFNNVGIAFRTLAGGVVAGIGALLVLLMNGIMIGSLAGYLTAIGDGTTFWSFVVGHSAPELLAIVISGAAGLKLGLSWIAPGDKTRGEALKQAARIGARMILGAFAMLVLAAFIEAYWSSMMSVPAGVKYAVGAIIWCSFLAWFTLGGRRAG